MTKETLIIFVYDTQMNERERDEPASPVLYFYPTWVSSEQKSALCGQIVGTVECVGKLFCRPKILTVASGNFYIMFKGRFIFAVGTETNSTNLRLQHKANILFSLFEFLHADLNLLLSMGKTELLSSKLQSIVDNHLRMLMYSNSILFHKSNIPSSKSMDGVYMDAVHILESCQALEGVLGGLLLYKNKVVASQLSSDLTQRLSSADLHRIHCSATPIEHQNLPSGINLFQVYISSEDYVKLLENSEKSKNVFGRLHSGEMKTSTKNEKRSQDMAILSTMKRDQSLLFTAVPEDASVSWDQPYIPTTKRNRPKFLNLKTTISIGNSNELKSKVNSGTPLCSQTSICSTPLKELKKVIHQHPLSICHNEEDDGGSNKLGKTFSDLGTQNECAVVTSDLQDTKNRFKSFSNIADLFTTSKKHSDVPKFKTISDPTFPVFKEDGTIISVQYPRDLNGKKNPHQSNGNAISFSRKKADKIAEAFIKKDMSTCDKNNKPENSLELLDLLTRNQRQTDGSNGEFSKTLNSKLGKLIGEQTPTFSKLCHMKKDSADPVRKYPCQEYKTKNVETEKTKPEEGLKECSLLVNGKQDICMAVLLSKENSKEQNSIMKMSEMSTEYIDKLQRTFRREADSYSSESNQYSYLYLDSDWNSVKQKGTWSEHDLTIVGYLCEEFTDANNEITEVLVRCCLR
ncbi:unnamed protein product [Phaedon cochleariae]|uniref:CCZ1/INTU/HSP4 first Longin domain-containing protein n=1 Tax=Phaedon cochleariae TaxID=80249 RepID=A0A9N9X2I0_PHACE|nr:unnamed protein product [Phaedon cochleariae]